MLAAPVTFQHKSWVFLYCVPLVADISGDCLQRISFINAARLLEPPLGHVISQFVNEETLGVYGRIKLRTSTLEYNIKVWEGFPAKMTPVLPYGVEI